ncbi:MAG: COX aromatic rich motif-containing protein [Salinisphaera sp.]|jgi:cytochrome o ubiquinol oxidase subunit 2|nr:COX aromatic rich motif-containing protein [Salinisphaera sp.]
MRKALFFFLLAGASLPASASSVFWVLSPEGPVAKAQLRLLIIDVVVIAATVVPTIGTAAYFLWRYRASNTQSRYEPKWSRSIPIEIGIWGIPVIVVGVLAYFVVTGTMATDPYSPDIITASHSNSDAKAHGQSAIDIDVIALDWRWLFVYPKQHVASFHEIALPVDTPVHFKLTSSTVTNSFFIPQLAGQIYVMPGMRTRLVLLASHKGTYTGFSANQSGAGFSYMRFKTRVVSRAQFEQWIHKAQRSPQHLGQAEFEKLAQPKIDRNTSPEYFADVKPGLFRYVIKQVKHGKVYPTQLKAGEDNAS